MIQDSPDIDLEELESRLYSQVFHSAPNADDADKPPLESVQTNVRSVTQFSVSNVQDVNKQRYFCETSKKEEPVVVSAPQSTVPEAPAEQGGPKIVPPLQEFIPISDKEKRKQKNKRKRSKRKQQREMHRQPPWKLPPPPFFPIPSSTVIQNSLGMPPPSLLNPPYLQGLRSVTDRLPSFDDNFVQTRLQRKPPTKTATNTVSVIEISDSDDSIEIILPKPAPVYEISSSDECTPENRSPTTKTSEPTSGESATVTAPEVKEIVINPPVEPPKTATTTETATITETERTELLQTPDSAANDFIENDINSLDGSTFCFNFSLIDSDLDSADKDFLKPGSVQKNTPALDVYESESCSSTGTPTKPPVFNEVNFESPTKEIFCESDMTYFSEFITPVRPETTEQVKRKAKLSESKTDGSEKVSSEYDSDPTVVKKKSKKKKKKKKKCSENATDTEAVESPDKTKKKRKKKSVDPVEEPISLEEIADDSRLVSENENAEPSESPENNQIDTKETVASVPEPPDKPVVEQSKSPVKPYVTIENESDKVIVSAEKKPANSSITPITISDEEIPKFPLLEKHYDFLQAWTEQRVNQKSEPPKDEPVIAMDINLANVSHKPSGFSIDTAGSSKIDDGNSFKSFKDFWTLDMKKFYDDSWGQENYDLESVLISMPADKSKWSINKEDLSFFKTQRRGTQCMNCKEFGHYRDRCPNRKEMKCCICGQAGHLESRCPNVLCTRCGNQNGYLTTSCHKCSNFCQIRCTICNFYGHPDSLCPDQWRKYHLTMANDDELQVQKVSYKTPEQSWCSSCAGRGHLNHECSYINLDHYPTSPYVVDSAIRESALSRTSNYRPPNLEALRVPDLRRYRENMMHSTHGKYESLMRNMRRKCERHLPEFLRRVEHLENILRKRELRHGEVSMVFKLQKAIQHADSDYRRGRRYF